MAQTRVQVPLGTPAGGPTVTVSQAQPMTPEAAMKQAKMEKKEKEKAKGKSAAMYYGIIFIVVLILAFIVFYLLKPQIVLKREPGGRILEEVDFVRVLIGSVIVAIIVVLIFWLFGAFMMKQSK